jgi:hypothetical protein
MKSDKSMNPPIMFREGEVSIEQRCVLLIEHRVDNEHDIFHVILIVLFLDVSCQPDETQ